MPAGQAQSDRETAISFALELSSAGKSSKSLIFVDLGSFCHDNAYVLVKNVE